MTNRQKLAMDGGPKAKQVPYTTQGARFQDNELKYLKQALKQNTLFYGFGTMVKQACELMHAYTGMPYIVPCSSGSAAIHLGLIAAGIGPGDEVIMTPNTDAGTALGVIEEGAVPVFCDPDFTLQPDVRGIAACITRRTRAVIVVHLAGYPAPVDAIVRFCRRKGIAVVEDCAQSWGARLRGKLVGTFGDAGCYSTNDFKHISTGDGGFVALRDAELYRRVSNYADKYYDRLFDRSQAQAHHGINYRMSELQGAVARAQLEKVDRITRRHNAIGELLRTRLKALRGAHQVAPISRGYSTYWWTALFIEPRRLTASRDKLVAALQAEGLAAGSYGRYDLIQKKLFQDRIARPWLKGWKRKYPFVQPDGREYRYSLADTPRHQRMLETGIMLSINVNYTDRDVRETADGILKVFAAFAK